jgi:hypothetical protein
MKSFLTKSHNSRIATALDLLQIATDATSVAKKEPSNIRSGSGIKRDVRIAEKFWQK